MADERIRYSPEEVQAILERALARRQGEPGGITHDDLMATARELGIDDRDLQEAIQEHEETWALEDARQRWKEQRKRKFFEHLRTYLIVNAALAILDLLFTGGSWFFWPLFGWGIGLAMDASEAFRPKEKDVERGARRLLRKEQKERRKEESRQYWHNLSEGIKKQFVVDSKQGKVIIQKGDRRIEIG